MRLETLKHRMVHSNESIEVIGYLGFARLETVSAALSR